MNVTFADTVVDTTIAASTLSFGSVDPGVTKSPAAENPVQLNNTANSNTVIDVYLNNTNMTSGGNSILYNYTSVNTVSNNSSITRLNGSIYINGTSANTGFVENLGISSNQILYFWQDVPNGQAPGVYTQTINIRSMQGGIAP